MNTWVLLVNLVMAFFCEASVTLVPSPLNVVCPYGRAVFTCTTTSGKLRWTISSVKVYYNSPEDINRTPVVISNAGFSVKLDKSEGNVFVSTATADNVPFDFEGEAVACADTPSHSSSERKAVIKLSSAPPSSPTPSGFHAISFTSAVLLWKPPHDTPLCAHNYTVHISRVSSGADRRTHSNGTFITISELSQGVEYAFIVQATDRAGRTGSSSLPMYFVLDVPNRVANLTVTLSVNASRMAVHIHWERVVSHRPSITHYLLRHDITVDHSTAVVTVYDTHYNIFINTTTASSDAVFVEITPFNELGAGIPCTTTIRGMLQERV